MTRHYRSPLKAVGVGLLASVVVASTAFASGFSIFEQGAKASGVAGAFVAFADDASANWYNPANLVWMDGTQFQIGGNVITVGEGTDMTALDPSFGIFEPTVFEPESSIETPIHLYYTKKVSSNIAWGLGLTTPFGLVTEWQARPITYSANRSELTTFVLNPNVAFRLTETISVAIGVDYIFADVGSFSREVPIDLDGNPLNGFEVTGFSDLTGDTTELGWNVALSYQGNSTSFGFTYRTGFELELDGQIEYSDFGPLAPLFPNSSGTASIELPAQAAIGWGVQLTNQLSLEIDVAWAEWSAFDAIVVDLDTETTLSRDFELVENWDDTMSYRLGVFWKTSPSNEWRFGAVLDESPVPAEYLRPSIPDSDRTGFTIGFGHKGQRFTLDLYYMYLEFDELTAISGEEGVIGGTYDPVAQLAGASLNFQF